MTRAEFISAIQGFVQDTDGDVAIAMANLIIRELAREGLYFGRIRDSISTLAPVEVTSEITITQGSASVAHAGGFDEANDPGQVIKIEGSSVWYGIDSVAVGGATATLSSTFEGADVASGDATIAYPRVILPSTLAWVRDIRRPNRRPLTLVGDEISSEGYYNPDTREPQRYFYATPVNSDGYSEIFLLDFPDAVYTYMVNGPGLLTLYGAGTTTKCGIPEIYEDVLLMGATYLLWDSEDDMGRSRTWETRYRRGLKSMKKTFGPVDAGQMGSVDAGRLKFQGWADSVEVS
jgi:hypothetical protein